MARAAAATKEEMRLIVIVALFNFASIFVNVSLSLPCGSFPASFWMFPLKKHWPHLPYYSTVRTVVLYFEYWYYLIGATMKREQ